MTRFFRRITLVVFSVILLGVRGPAQQVTVPQELVAYSDMVLHSGTILTIDPNDTVAQAVAIRDGKFLAVGSDNQVLRLAGPNTVKVDLDGKTVMPGIINTHIHPNRGGTGELAPEIRAIAIASGSIRDWSDKSKALAQLQEFAQKEQREWVTIGGGDPTDAGLLSLRIADLDSVSPDKPLLVRIGSWRGVINTRALEELRKRYTNIPGVFEENGRPTGQIIAAAYWMIIEEILPQFPHEALAPMFKKTLLENLAPVGITTFSTRLRSRDARAYRLLDQQGEMPLRLAFGHEVGRWNPMFDRDMKRMMTDITGYGTDKIWLNSISIGIPDIAPTRGGEVCSQWQKIRTLPGDNFPGGYCLMDTPGDPTIETIRLIHQYGYRIGNTHTYGDLGNQRIIEALEQAHRERPIAQYTALDHSQLFNPTVIRKSGELGMIWSLSPTMFAGERSEASTYTYGFEVTNRMLAPVKSLLDAGALVAYEGESSNENPFDSMKIFVTRETRRGDKLGEQEAVDRKTALRIMTLNGAKYVLREDKLGSIETGKWADLIVIDRNPLDPQQVPDDQIGDIQVLKTVVGGEVIYDMERDGPRKPAAPRYGSGG